MEKMKHIDGYGPSTEDTEKLNEIVTWLTDHGYRGMMLVHKDSIGVSWCNEQSADDVRHTFINSLGYIMNEKPNIATNMALGMQMALRQIAEA